MDTLLHSNSLEYLFYSFTCGFRSPKLPADDSMSGRLLLARSEHDTDFNELLRALSLPYNGRVFRSRSNMYQ